MTDYAKIALSAKYSTDSAYTDPIAETRFTDHALTPDEYEYRKLEVDTAALTADLTNYASISTILLHNRDTANAVWVEANTILGTANYTVTFAETAATIADDGAGGTFVTNGAKAGGAVYVTNAAIAGNGGLAFPIIIAAVNLLTFNTDKFTDDAADAVTLQFLGTYQALLPAGGFLVINAVLPSSNLILTAQTASVSTDIFILGS